MNKNARNNLRQAAEAAQANQHDGMALNRYGELMAPAVALDLLDQIDKANKFAEDLALSLWKAHYRETAPDFQVFAEAPAIIGQIDNMAAGLGTELSRNKRMLLNTAISMGAIGEVLGLDMDADADMMIGAIQELKEGVVEIRQQRTMLRAELIDIRNSCELSRLRDGRIDAVLHASEASKGKLPDCPFRLPGRKEDMEELMRISGIGEARASLICSMGFSRAQEWISVQDQPPEDGQWCVVAFNEGFRAGQYQVDHPFGPAVVDRHLGRYYQFSNWKPLSPPAKTE